MAAVRGLDDAARALAACAQTLRRATAEATAYVTSTVTSASRLADEPVGGTLAPAASGPALSADLAGIYANSFEVDGVTGRFFLAPGDEFRGVAGSMPPTKNGTYLAMVHGNPSAFGVGDQTLGVEELAKLIESDPNYQAQPIVLFSCSTGHGDSPIAQHLADRLGVAVTAPTESAWLPPDESGRVIVTPENSSGGQVLDASGQGLGWWRRFEPRGHS
jgi:hypothetical protein